MAKVVAEGTFQYKPQSYAVPFCGVQASQTWHDLLLWEMFFNEHTEVNGLIELGSGNGGLSLFFAMQCYQREIEFNTFDNQNFVNTRSNLGRLLGMGSKFTQTNVFGAGREIIERLIHTDSLHPLILFCDNGNKPREFAEFGGLLRSGDYIAAHDYGVEFFDHDAMAFPVTPIQLDECIKLNSITRWYQKL